MLVASHEQVFSGGVISELKQVDRLDSIRDYINAFADEVLHELFRIAIANLSSLS